jgi:FkbM family methyltransferase
VARVIGDWPRFMFHYSLGLVPSSPYVFRSGARLQIGRGVDHAPIIEIFVRHDYGPVPDGATVIDLGANIGAFAIYAATTARDAIVYAYEPMAEFFRLLQHNVGLNGLASRVTCVNAAAAAGQASRALIVEPEGRLFPALAEPGLVGDPGALVPCTTLANVITTHGLDRVDLLKIDCEGAEYEILFGTPRAVFDSIGEIRMECHDLGVPGRNKAELRQFLESLDFTIVHDTPTSPGESVLWGRKYAAG